MGRLLLKQSDYLSRLHPSAECLPPAILEVAAKWRHTFSLAGETPRCGGGVLIREAKDVGSTLVWDCEKESLVVDNTRAAVPRPQVLLEVDKLLNLCKSWEMILRCKSYRPFEDGKAAAKSNCRLCKSLEASSYLFGLRAVNALHVQLV